MRTLILSVLLSLITLDSSFAVEISLDSHIHFYSNPDEFNQIDNFIKRSQIQKAVIISSAFLAFSPTQYDANRELVQSLDPEYQEEVKPEFRKKSYKMVSDYISEKGYKGLCGIKTSWEDLNEMIDYCLSLPNMIGLKIHSSGEENDYAERLSEILSTRSHSKLIVLWHPYINRESEAHSRSFLSSEYENEAEFEQAVRDAHFTESDNAQQENDSSIDQILSVINGNPSHTFIMAHVFEHIFGVKALYRNIGDLILPENLVFDCAGIIPGESFFDPILKNQAVDLWRTLGLDRILFGTDFGYFDEPESVDFIRNFKESSGFSNSELEQIMNTNGVIFFERL